MSVCCVLFAAFFLSGCLIFNYSSLLFNIGNLGNGAAAIEDASQLESELYADGPVDLPVTIAKLDGPDVEKITVTTGDANPSVNAFELTNGGPLNASSSRVLFISGSGGAVDVEQTPNLIAYSLNSTGVDTGNEVIVTANSDGSFEIEIEIDGENFEMGAVFAGLSADFSAASSFLKVVPQIVTEGGVERRNFAIVTTNTAELDATQSAAAGGDGYYYLSLASATSGNTFLRRNLDGTEVEILMEDVGADEHIDFVSTVSDRKIAYIGGDAVLRLILPSSTGLSLAKGGPLETEIVSFTKILTTLTSYDPQATKLMINEDEDGIIVNQYGAENVAVNYVRTVSGSVIPIVQSGFYDDAKAALSVDADLLYVAASFEGQYILYRVDVSGNIAAAWGERETLADETGFTAVHGMEVSGNGVVAIDADDSVGVRTLYYWTEATGLVAASDSSDGEEYANPKVSADGSYVIACRLDAVSGNQLVYHQPGVNAAGEVKTLTNDTGFSYCDEGVGSYLIDPRSLIQLYRSNADGSLPQHAVINLRDVE